MSTPLSGCCLLSLDVRITAPESINAVSAILLHRDA
jgi:hypothetical protein